jgi:hypothetical protein
MRAVASLDTPRNVTEPDRPEYAFGLLAEVPLNRLRHLHSRTGGDQRCCAAGNYFRSASAEA